MRRLRWRSEGYVVGQYDSVWKTRNGNASRVECLFNFGKSNLQGVGTAC